MKQYMTKMIVIAAAAAALSGCGRDNYNGKYVGYETQLNPSSQYPIEQRIELDLSHDKSIVSGTITYVDTGQTGQFSAISENSNKLDNVEIRIGMQMGQQMYQPGGYTGGYMPGGYNMYSNCVGTFRGSLDAPGDGRRLTGTLNAANTSSSTLGGASTCQGKNLTVNRH